MMGNKFRQSFDVQSTQKERKGKNAMWKDSEQKYPAVGLLRFAKVFN